MITQLHLEKLVNCFSVMLLAALLNFGICLQANAQPNSPKNSKGQIAPSGDSKGTKILTISVVHGATQSNMRQLPVTNGKGHQNWGCVKAPDSYVWVMVTLSKNDAETINAIDWHDQGAPLPNYDNRYRRFGKSESKRYAVKPTLGTPARGLREIYIWVIWGNYEIHVGGKLDATQSSTFVSSGVWSAFLGGGSSLGPADVKSHPSLTYRYAVGRTQGIAYLTPSGVEQRVNPKSWRMRRSKISKFYNNGRLTNQNPSFPSSDPDDSSPGALDLIPTDNPFQGPPNTIYDVDAPGCPSTAPTGSQTPIDAIDHTAEHYANYNSWAACILDKEYKCSDVAKWGYKARLDADRPSTYTTTVMNKVTAFHMSIDAQSFYDPA